MLKSKVLRNLRLEILVLQIFSSLTILTTGHLYATEGLAWRSESFDREIKPLLKEHCFGCHADGEQAGSMSFDDLLESTDHEGGKKIWFRVLKQSRAGLMPPPGEPQPSLEQRAALERWILEQALGVDSKRPDPGKVTVRRLNRLEYRNTVRELLGVEFDTETNFPPDDTGHGFDNMADVLTVSPLLLEKYVDAAHKIISSTVPTSGRVMREQKISGASFSNVEPDASSGDGQAVVAPRKRFNFSSTKELSYYTEAKLVAAADVEIAGDYQVKLELAAVEDYKDNEFDTNRCEFRFLMDGEELLQREFVRHNSKEFVFTFDRQMAQGPHQLVIQLKPLTQAEQIRNLRLRIKSVTLVGPSSAEHWVRPAGYEKFFPRDVPTEASQRRGYARELIVGFATRAYRRPVDEPTAERLVELAEFVYTAPNQSFEAGVAKAMTAIIASPRFVFREEQVLDSSDDSYPLIDEYSLASRLSYFLWSTMPDEELLLLASQNQLRANLDGQVRRMLEDRRSQAFVESFAGQWLQARAVQSIQINAFAVAGRESKTDQMADQRRRRFFELLRIEERTTAEEEELNQLRPLFRAGRSNRVELTDEVRRAMKQETEMVFDHIVRGDRSLLEFLDSNYTFLNETLAKYYQIPGIEGERMQQVELEPESLRGGILTHGTTLVVTSNPDRTSPVKRGLFILDNLLGIPTPAPPPDVPSLEDASKQADGKKLSLRESLALHRESAVCSSCHNRMDPLGLALENFNALGRYRDQEVGQAIDPSGKLISGESFENVRQLKKILANDRRIDFYRCFTEKLMTYALGREVDYHDLPTIDRVVGELESNGGKSLTVLLGIIHSDAFQRSRNEP